MNPPCSLLLCALSVCALMGGCAMAGPGAPVEPTGSEALSLRILQEEVELPVEGGAVSLARAPFVLELRVADPERPILVHAGTTGETWERAIEGASYVDLPGFSNTGMAEGHSDRHLALAPTAPSSWTPFVKDSAWLRFDQPCTEERAPEDGEVRWLCRRTIERIHHIDHSQWTPVVDDLPIEESQLPAVYLVVSDGSWSTAHGHLRDPEGGERNRLAVRLDLPPTFP